LCNKVIVRKVGSDIEKRWLLLTGKWGESEKSWINDIEEQYPLF
jgi:hypothetical protein